MYTIVINNKIVFGPRPWLYKAFTSALNKHNIEFDLPRSEPDGSILTDTFKLLPARIVDTPGYTDPFEQLAGPYWELKDTEVLGSYKVVPTELDFAKNRLKQKVTDNRYSVEVGGCQYTFSDGTEVTLYTSREDRNVYLQAYQTMHDEQSITFKFSNSIFKTVTKQDLASIVAAGITHIQNAFEWEATKYLELDRCTSHEELKAIDIEYQKIGAINGS